VKALFRQVGRMKRFAFSPAALALVLSLSLIAAATCNDEEGVIDGSPRGSKFMPLRVGNEWEYQVTVEARGKTTLTHNVRYKITRKLPATEGRDAYVIEITEDGAPQPDIMASARDGATLLDRGYWAALIWDEIAEGMWTETGLVVDIPLQCIGRDRPAVPAGEFDCVVLYAENESEMRPESWGEYYAEDVGLVEYTNYYKEYDTSTPPQLVDWREVRYALAEYKVGPE
jgi:hypothetical protein